VESLPQPLPGPAPDPAGVELTHPGWCDPDSCVATSGGPHRSVQAIVAGDPIGSGRLRLRLWSPSDDPDGPVVLVELVATDRDTGHRLRVDLSVRQLDQLRRALAVIAAQADDR
jgi:hypothetical protein